MPNPSFIQFDEEVIVTGEIARSGQSIVPGTIQSQTNVAGAIETETLVGEHI